MSEKLETKNLVTVYGSGIQGPLLTSNDVRLIQIRDADGNLVALVTRLTDALWGISARGDADWEDHKRHLFIDEAQNA